MVLVCLSLVVQAERAHSTPTATEKLDLLTSWISWQSSERHALICDANAICSFVKKDWKRRPWGRRFLFGHGWEGVGLSVYCTRTHLAHRQHLASILQSWKSETLDFGKSGT